MRVVFLQLPQLDTDTRGGHENVPLAARLLARALRRHAFDVPPDILEPPAGFDALDDAHLVDALVDMAPDIIAATLYLWNVERTLDVLRRVRGRLPGVRVALGGPEVSREHPFLTVSDVPDALVEGEGEPVVAEVVACLAGRPARTDVSSIGLRGGAGWAWGAGRPPHAALADVWPRPEEEEGAAAGSDIAYLEASRGCPLRCAYCCYNQRRSALGFLSPSEVAHRLEALRDRGVREVRFIDPTFNSHPEFDALLAGIARVNRRRSMTCFAELRAETLTPRQIGLLARGGFTEIEVGIQSLDREVLRAIRRPTRLDALEPAVRQMAAAGIRLTLDVMGALPLQRLDDVKRTLEWAAAVPGSRVQFMHTLALPGTELRRRWAGDLRHQALPPYRVLSTRWMSAGDLRQADACAETVTGTVMDVPTVRFVGRRLEGMFSERVRIDADAALPARVGGRSCRRAVTISGRDLFARQDALAAWMAAAVRSEPHILWQFILSPEHEEPLDLLDRLAAVLRRLPTHVLDRSTVGGRPGQRVARRVFVQLRAGARYDAGWRRAAENLLRAHFH